MARKKHSNPILENPDNGGIHSTRRLKSVQTMMTSHGLSNAVVYQFILSGSTRKEYQATIKALARHIRTKCRAEYVGAYEIGDEKGGEHAHAYFIVETLHHFPGDLLNVSAGQWIARRIARTGMSIRIEPPKAPMHRGAMFARMDTADKLADVIKWVEYHVKGRSKDAVPDREIYFASEFASNARKREAKRQKYRDAVLKSSRKAAPQAAQEALDASVATQVAPFLPVDCSTGKGNQTNSEKASHEGITTPQCGTEGQSTSQDHASTTESLYSSSSSTLGRSRSWHAQDSKHGSSGPTGQAIRPGQSHGGASRRRSETYQPVTPLPRIDAGNFSGVYFAPAPTTGGPIMLTTAQKYIASRYEEAVDLGLDLDAVRAYLLAHGIKRTPAAVVFDLDVTYGFHDYVNSHPAPANMSTEVMDRIIDQMKVREAKRLFVQHKRTLPRRLDSGLHS